MDWSHLKVVLAVSRGGSMTAAANLLGTDQTTIGRRLTALEEDLGTPLFVRSKAGFLPTDHGQRAIDLAVRMEVEVEAMLDEISETGAGATGTVRLMGNPWMLQRLARAALPELLAANPALTVALSGRLPPTPLHGDPTISLWFDASARKPDKAFPIAAIPYGVFVSADADVDPTRWVLFRDDDARGPSFTRQVQKRLGRDARVALTATDAGMLAAAIQGGIGQGHLPRCVGTAAPGLVEKPEATPSLDRILHVHVNPTILNTRRVAAVLQWLEDAIAPALSGRILPDYRKQYGNS